LAHWNGHRKDTSGARARKPTPSGAGIAKHEVIASSMASAGCWGSCFDRARFALTFQRAGEAEFSEFVEQWHKETDYLSSNSKKIEHPAHRAIIDLGKLFVPLILKELWDRPELWFEVLKAITGCFDRLVGHDVPCPGARRRQTPTQDASTAP
jgi:hypothetical protein